MDGDSAAFWEAAKGWVDAPYVTQAQQVMRGRWALARSVLQSGKMPEEGWEERDIEWFLEHCAAMDSNNFSANVGVGEREGRVVAPLVRRLAMGLAHGVGRSGDVAAVQPKAAGSSLVAKLSNSMVLDALHVAGLVEMTAAIVVPCATGLTLALCLLALRAKDAGPDDDRKRVVIWLRIDQKSCLKGIALAGMRVVVVEGTRDRAQGSPPSRGKKKDEKATKSKSPLETGLGEELLTDAGAVAAKVAELGSEAVLAVVSTTSCFAPRAPDDVESVGKVCAAHGVRHVVNNAYGVQCAATGAAISRAQRVARVDLVVSSTDKNFLVPVGGAVVASSDKDLVAHVAKSYPGRASATPTRDLFITLLHLGRHGWRSLLAEREALVDPFRAKLAEVARKHGERVLDGDFNRISCAVSLTTVGHDKNAITKFGSMLFTRLCSGARVVVPALPDGASIPPTTVAGITFAAFGSNSSSYHLPYFTVAVALGVRPNELDEFLKRLDKTFAHVHKRLRRRDDQSGTVTPDDDAATTTTV